MTDRLQEQVASFAWALKSHIFIVADKIDRQADAAATVIRDTLSNSTWLPEAARPMPSSPPLLPPRVVENATGGMGAIAWVKENKWAVGLMVGTGLGIGGYLYGKSRKAKKMRARRAPDGGRKEVIVLAGSPHDPISKNLALDMERRGFIVFIVVNNIEDERAIVNEGRGDIRPLNIDILDQGNVQTAIEKFNTYLSTPTQSFPGAHLHRLHLSGVIILPDTTYPSGPLETIPVDYWSDALLKILSSVVIAKSFLRTVCESNSRLLILTPNVIPPLAPPFHAPEAVAIPALDSLATSLRRELAPAGVDVCHIKLGTFDTSNTQCKSPNPVQLLNAARADILQWPPAARATYAKNYAAQQSGKGIGSHGNGSSGMYKGSPLRELHLAVFDALTAAKPKGVTRVGSGSFIYEILGRYAPNMLVEWMLNIGRREEINGVGLGWGGGSTSNSEESVDWEKV